VAGRQPSSVLLPSLPPWRGGRREKEGVYRVTHTRARARARASPPLRQGTHGHSWKRGAGSKRDRAERLIWFNGEFIWVDSPPFNQQDCLRPPTDTATDRLPCRPTFSLPSPRKIIPVKPPLYHHRLPIVPSRAPGAPTSLRLLVGELSKPRRRLLPPANPQLVSFVHSLSPLLARAPRASRRSHVE